MGRGLGELQPAVRNAWSLCKLGKPAFCSIFACGQLPNAIAPQDVASQIANMTVIRARLGGNMIQGFCRIGHSAAAELFVWGT